MTIYLNPYARRFRRQFMADFMNEVDSDYEPQVSFPLDVKASPEGYQLKAYLPGVAVEDVEVQIVNEIVTINGEVKLQRDPSSEYLITELPSGRFHRVISLPTPLDSNDVEATLENGILTLDIPKAAEAKPKAVKVQKK
ncbi:MAG: Hsp20/alpha crystallin family protein [Anaerolineaceae bacterium]